MGERERGDHWEASIVRDAGIATELQGSRSETGSGSRDWEQVDGGRGTEMETETKNAGRESRQGNQ